VRATSGDASSGVVCLCGGLDCWATAIEDARIDDGGRPVDSAGGSIWLRRMSPAEQVLSLRRAGKHEEACMVNSNVGASSSTQRIRVSI
jgi:hypothetical protein